MRSSIYINHHPFTNEIYVWAYLGLCLKGESLIGKISLFSLGTMASSTIGCHDIDEKTAE
jgi:hypothetical protein